MRERYQVFLDKQTIKRLERLCLKYDLMSGKKHKVSTLIGRMMEILVKQERVNDSKVLRRLSRLVVANLRREEAELTRDRVSRFSR